MRSAPPVRVRCRGGAWHALQSGLAALAAGVLCAWLLRHAGLGAWAIAAAAAGAALLAGRLAWRAWRADPVEVIWDGQRWSAGGQAGSLDVMLDLGAWLLLRLRPEGAALGWPQAAAWRSPPEGAKKTWGGPAFPCAHWIAVSAHDAGSAMHGLRVALYARVPAATQGGGPAQRPRV